MIGCVSQWGTGCRRFLVFGSRLVTQNNPIREISLASTFYAAKPGVAIGGLGSKATSKKKLGKLGAATEKLVLSAETDTQKLHDYVCGSNLLKEGGEDIKIKPDSEYPDWLWTLRTGKFPDLSEMDPDSKEYWLKVRRMGKVKNNKLMKFKRF